MIKRYLWSGAAVALLLVVAWIADARYEAGYNKARVEQGEAIAKAVEQARKEWDTQVAADEQIADTAEQREVEIREVEKIVYRDIIRWKEPDGCRDLGAEFRRLFNSSPRPVEPDTAEAP